MTAKIWNFSVWVNNCDAFYLKEETRSALLKSGFSIVGFIEKHFTPYGYTALFLLEESHFAIHTFPEQNRAYLELSSCNYEFFTKFKEILHLNKSLVITNKI